MRLHEIFHILDEQREFLFELRNVMNVDQLKQWADETAVSLADSLMVSPETYEVIRNWAQKALLKHAVKNLHGTKVKYYPEYPEYYHVGPQRHNMSELPQWAQNALQRGDELEVVQPWVVSIAHGDIGREVSLVRDYLRYKHSQDPRMFTPNRLARIPWTEAVRLTQEYHTELERKRPRTVQEMMHWFRENPDPYYAWLNEALSHDTRLFDLMLRTLKTERGDYTYKDFLETLGPRLFDSLQKAFKKASGFSVQQPKDDPEGREPYLRYDDKGAILPPEPAAQPDPTLHMDWGDEDQDGALEPDEEDFEQAPEIGPGWYKLNTTACVEYEGTLMGHCVGGYGQAVEKGSVQIYSLRDKNNEPHVTIEVTPLGYSSEETSGAQIEQIKGKENKAPRSKYIPQVIDFIEKISKDFGEVEFAEEANHDLEGMAIVADQNGLHMPNPPFDTDKFSYYEKLIQWEEGEDYPDEEITDERTSISLGEVIEELENNASWYGIKPVLDELMKGSCWYSEGEETSLTGSYEHSVCYNGDDKWTTRKWKNVRLK